MANVGQDPAELALAIRLFGPWEVCVRGAPLPPLRSRTGQWLLALLVLRTASGAERSWSEGMLWPDDDP